MLAESPRIRLASIVGENIYKSAPLNSQIEIHVEKLKVRYDVLVTIDRPQSQVRIKIGLMYSSDGNLVFSGEVASVFDVVELDSFISEKGDDGEFRVEQDFFPMLVNIAFGTTRGYFAARNVGTVLEDYPFPMMDMENVMKHVEYQLI